MSGQHRWASAYVVACRHIYILQYLLHISLANKIVLVVALNYGR